MVGHFVYVTTDHESGKFYIGKHTTKNQNDSYVGSGVWIQNCKKAGIKLQKQIIAKCQSEDDAYAFEEKMVAAFRKKYPKLCMNFVDGGKGCFGAGLDRWAKVGAKLVCVELGISP